MTTPAKDSLSVRYSKVGMCGALGWFDQGVAEGLDMDWTYATGGMGLIEGLLGKGGRGKELCSSMDY